MKIIQPIFIVGIGGSAGALNAYKDLLDAMPDDMGMAFVIISHMNPDSHSQLNLILQRHTKMSVIIAADTMEIIANKVYIIPSNADLTMDNYSFKVVSPRSGGHKQIDLFFISLAEAMGKYAVGIVLSGYNGDGTLGCKQIKANGGKTFAQNRSAEVNHMPLNAQRAGWVDFVLPLNKIPAKLKSLAAELKV